MFTMCQKQFKHFTCANLFSPYDNICLELSLSSLYRSEDSGTQKFKKNYTRSYNPWSSKDSNQNTLFYIFKEYTNKSKYELWAEKSNHR